MGNGRARGSNNGWFGKTTTAMGGYSGSGGWRAFAKWVASESSTVEVSISKYVHYSLSNGRWRTLATHAFRTFSKVRSLFARSNGRCNFGHTYFENILERTFSIHYLMADVTLATLTFRTENLFQSLSKIVDGRDLQVCFQ